MTDREWADYLHGELGQVLYIIRDYQKVKLKDTYAKNSFELALRAFKSYKEKVQKLDYETGRPL